VSALNREGLDVLMAKMEETLFGNRQARRIAEEEQRADERAPAH
jgi:hypothetical protein